MAEGALDIIKRLVSLCREANMDDHRTGLCIRQSLESEGFLRGSDEDAGPKKVDPLRSTIVWNTDFTNVPKPRPGYTYLVLRWSGRFEMTCKVFDGGAPFEAFLKSMADINQREKRDGVESDYKEFAWSEVVQWPGAAHEAIAARLQEEADSYAKKAEAARKQAA